MDKLVVVIMGQNCEKFIRMCLDSVKDANVILYCDGGSKDTTLNIVRKFRTNINTAVEVLENEWNPEDKAMNGKQRNFYLNYLKENYPDDWCLVLDADEIVEDINKIKEFIQTKKDGVFDVHMRHFIGSLGWEDNTRLRHSVPRRLFKISDAKSYPEHSHPVLETDKSIVICDVSTIWHMGHLPVIYMDYVLKRYKEHSNDSMIHTQEFLKQWKYAHLLGLYPVKQINPIELPKQICDRWEIDKDEFYFKNRQNLEIKHFLMSRNWINKFNPKSILDIGCGFGLFGYAMKTISPEIKYTGIDISKYVGENWHYNNMELINDDIINVTISDKYDLVLFIDILEHLSYKDLDGVLKSNCKIGKNIVFSIPFIGDPNLESDETHIIKESKDWWIEKLSKYFIVEDAPKEWLFNHQLLIGKRK